MPPCSVRATRSKRFKSTTDTSVAVRDSTQRLWVDRIRGLRRSKGFSPCFRTNPPTIPRWLRCSAWRMPVRRWIVIRQPSGRWSCITRRSGHRSMGSFGNSLERWTAPSAGRRSPTHSDPFCNASDAAQGSPLSLRHRRRCAHRSVCGRRNGGAASSQDPLPRTSMRIASRSGRPRMDGFPTRGTGESV